MAEKLTKEEIARQFQLPERKSKIATLLKQDGQAYCICRSSDSSRFMIGCDSCEEWYHGDCIGITQKEAKHIKQYFCERCQEEDPSLETKFKPIKSQESEPKCKQKKDRPVEPKRKIAASRGSCGECSNCRRTHDCGDCRICKDGKKSGVIRRREKCLNRICIKTGKGGAARKVKPYNSDSSSDGEISYRIANSAIKDGMQCYGPGCTQIAKPNSKYCSHNCGVKLATNRVYQVLPQRIQEWSLSPSIAEQLNRKQLESIRKSQEEARAALQELDKRHMELDAVIERAKNVFVDPDAEEDNEDECEASMYCITCGQEIHSRSAIKHMEKCFNKYESQSSFGSIYKTRIEGNNMFCDYYNVSNKTYCKRLRVLCPEHYKDPKIRSTEVCGCPLVKHVFQPSDEFCRTSKKSCVRHYCWEKLRRAEIDMERVRQWLKIDELIEQERQIRQRMACRAGVLPLLLHSTYDHDAMEQMTAAQNQERLAALEDGIRNLYDKEQFENVKLSKAERKLLKTLANGDDEDMKQSSGEM